MSMGSSIIVAGVKVFCFVLVIQRCHVLVFLVFKVLPPHSQRANHIRNAHRWCAVIRKPRSV